MGDSEFWIIGGKRLASSHGEALPNDAESRRINIDGAVKVTQKPTETEVKWSVFSPCFASLFHVIEWLPAARLPIILKFYLHGWFEETFATAHEAVNRIEQVIGKSDLHLTKRAFVEELNPTGRQLPPMLEKTWSERSVAADNSIDFVFEEKSKKYLIERIGSKSTIAKYYGVSPVSYPYVNGGSYDDIVYEAYGHVLRSGTPRYDHVLAAMRMPDNILRWVPYQRIVIPKESIDNMPSVRVITEIASVDICPI